MEKSLATRIEAGSLSETSINSTPSTAGPHRYRKAMEAVEEGFNLRDLPMIFVEHDVLRIGHLYSNREDPDFIFHANDPECYHWLEKARWVWKFEETFNETARRFNAAHVSPLKFKDVVEFRTHLENHLYIVESDETSLAKALKFLTEVIMKNDAVEDVIHRDILYGILMTARLHPDVKQHHRIERPHLEFVNMAYQHEESYFTTQQGGMPRKHNSQRRLSIFQGLAKSSADCFNNDLAKALGPHAEACCVLSGKLDCLTRPVMKLLRLNYPIAEPGLIEVNVPVRFIFLCLGPSDRDVDYDSLARCFAVMLKNRRFRAMAYSAQTGSELLEASNLFLETSLVLPLYKHITAYNLGGMAEQMRRYQKEITELDEPKNKNMVLSTSLSGINNQYKPLETSKDSTKFEDMMLTSTTDLLAHSMRRPNYRKKFLEDFCPPGVALYHSLKPFKQRYLGDYTDAFKPENLSVVFTGVLFVYFVCLAPAITFGALLNAGSPAMSVVLVIFGSGLYLVIFGLFSGQPQGIIGVTAPAFIIETSIQSVAKSFQMDIGVMRAWVSLYAALIGCVFLIFNVSVLTKHIRKSLEEIFNMFIAFFYLLKALFTMFKLIPPILMLPAPPVGKTGPYLNETFTAKQLAYSQRNGIAGATLFLAFIMLHFCVTLASWKRGTYFRRKIRTILGAFSVPMGILLVFALERIFFQGFYLSKLNIPPSDQINVTTWVNPVNLASMNNYGIGGSVTVHGISVVIGIAFFFLVFTEASFNGFTATKNKAVKQGVFEADFLLLLVILPLMSGFIGWPFVSGATVRTVSHISALTKMEERPPPGMTARIMGTAEQRISTILVGILVALSVCIGTVLQYIPIAALYGMFLYMGVMGMRDLTITRRIMALMKRRKHWEDWEYIRGLPTNQILVFAVIQVIFVGILIALNCISEFTTAAAASLVFPLVVFIYGLLREFALPYWDWISPYLHQMDKKHKLSGGPASTAQPDPGPSGGESGPNVLEIATPGTVGKMSFSKGTPKLSSKLSGLPADPKISRGNIFGDDHEWKRKTSAESAMADKRFSIAYNFDGFKYRELIAGLSAMQQQFQQQDEDDSDEEYEQRYRETWAT